MRMMHQTLTIHALRTQLNRRHLRQCLPIHFHNRVAMPSEHVGLIHFVDLDRTQIQRRRDDWRTQIDHLDGMRVSSHMNFQPATTAGNSQCRHSVGRHHADAQRCFRQGFRDPVDAIEHVIDFHTQMQRNSACHIEQGVAFQIFDSAIILSGFSTQSGKLPSGLFGLCHPRCDIRH